MTVTRKKWPPKNEVYCNECRRLVAAMPGTRVGAWLPETHYVFSTYDHNGYRSHSPSRRCDGRTGRIGMRSGMEDIRAAFHPDQPQTYTGPGDLADESPGERPADETPGYRFSYISTRGVTP